MKLTIFLVIVNMHLAVAMGYSQRIRIAKEQISLEDAFREIRKQSGYNILISSELLNKVHLIDLNLTDATIHQALQQCLHGQGLSYEIIGNNVIIKPIIGAQVTAQQDRVVTGVVRDADGQSIAGATVSVKSSPQRGTQTDEQGAFSISVPSDATLVVSYLGFATQEVPVTNRSEVTITLQMEESALDEVVIVGFGTQKKENLTGAVGVVSGTEFAERPVANVGQALQGMVPGLNITQTSGSLGTNPTVNVRGAATIGQGTSGAPLVLIDGMEGDLNAVNPQDIANISILKDAASSSIYGSRAPFGVILITTKSGNKDGTTSINYNNNGRLGSPINRMRMMNSVAFASWINDAQTNGGAAVQFDADRFARIVEYHEAKPYGRGQRIKADGTIIYPIEANENGQWLGGFSTGVNDVDWYDIIYQDQTFSQEHNLNASGGNQKFNYYLSGSFFDQNGFIEIGDEDFKRYTATAKINSELTPWLKVNYGMRFTREDYNRPSAMTDYLYEELAAKSWPVLAVYDRNGNYLYSDNTSVLALDEGGQDRTQTDNTYHQLGLVIEPVQNWLTHVDFNYRIESANRHWDTQYLYNHDINGAPYMRTVTSNVHEDYYKDNYYNFNARTEYAHTLADRHNFHILAGFQAENLKQTQFGLQRNGIMIPEKPEVDLTTGLDVNGNPIVPATNGARNDWATAGFFGRLNYDYDGRYLLEVNGRIDGSSRFRKGNQWKFFPSASAGWNIAQETFFEPLRRRVNLLKLRLSYGSLGNQNTDNWYQTYQTITASMAAGGWLQNGARTNIVAAPGLVSEVLTWETIESYNAGLDFVLLGNRLEGAFDYYIRDTRNMVGNAPALPAILGTAVPVTNNTDLRTRGWELSVGWNDALESGLTYSAKFLLSDSRSKITRYPNNPTGSINTFIEGRYMDEIWGYETVGLARTDEEMQRHLDGLPEGGQNALGSDWRAGDIMYADLNGDGRISGGSGTITDLGDMKLIGNSTPRYQFGLILNTAWKGFDVRVFFQGVAKRDYWQGSDYLFGASGDGVWRAVGITAVDNYFRDETTWSVQHGYRVPNTDAYLPRPLFSEKNLQPQTRYLLDASYIRLKNLQVGYSFPKGLTAKWGIRQLRVFLSGDNIWTGTRLPAQFDPETIGTLRGNGYPLSNTLSGGLSITF